MLLNKNNSVRKGRKNLLLFIGFVFFTFLFACRKEHVSNDICDCADSQSTYIVDTITLTIPNLFTPNGDCVNDHWVIKNIDKFPDNKVKITRPGLFGGSVYESTGYHQDWDDGKNNKKGLLKEGKYRYEITVNGQIINGFVCVYYGSIEPDSYDCLNACVVSDPTDPMLTGR